MAAFRHNVRLFYFVADERRKFSFTWKTQFAPCGFYSGETLRQASVTRETTIILDVQLFHHG